MDITSLGNAFHLHNVTHSVPVKRMTIEIKEQDLTNVSNYARIPIAFAASSVLDVTESPEIPGKFILTERTLSLPYVKDYDAIEGERPVDWARRFDVASWRMVHGAY